VSIAVGVLLLTVGVGLAQFPFGGMGGFGGFGKPSQLIRNDQVQKELKLSPEQLKKINAVIQEQQKKMEAAIEKAMGDVLEAEQSKRIWQISLQLSGFRAYADAKLQEELKFSDDQKDTVKKALTAFDEKISELRKEKAGGEQYGELFKETLEKLTAVLSDAQKDQFKEIKGEPFQLQFGKGKGFFKKKEE
jgi:hypothetical protein